MTGAIVDVTLQIDQHAVIERNAFKATLQLNNNAGAPISDLQVTINPVDASGNPATDLFDIAAADLERPQRRGWHRHAWPTAPPAPPPGPSSPTTNAAPTGPTQFAIGGTLSYMLDGQQVVIPLFAVPITVLPSPILNVDYFLQHDVYSQDPFVPQVRAAHPLRPGHHGA